MYFDGSLMKSGARAGLVFISSLSVRMRYMTQIHFSASNNVAQYEALVNGLHITTELGIRRLDVRGDSQLIVDQVMKESSCHDPKMASYCQVVRLLEDKFDGLELNHIARRSNEAADELAKLASDRAPVPTGVFASNLYKPSVTYQESAQDDSEPPASGADPTPAPADPKVMQIEEDPYTGPDPLPDWIIPYLDCLVRGVLPTDKTEAQRLARRAKSFVLLDQELYKRSPTGILQQCIPSEQGKNLMQDIHGGVYDHHAAPHTLVGNAFRQSFYWPTAVADATEVVRSCEGC
jgi:ribonuclease HI